MKIIGGFIPMDKVNGKTYHYNLVGYNLARHALTDIAINRGYSTLWLPDYICGCIAKNMENVGIKSKYYTLSETFQLDNEIRLKDNEGILIVNYFSSLTKEKVIEVKNTYNNIIVDNTQAFYSKPIWGVDTIYSCRKWFGVADGAYLSTDTKMPARPRDVSYQRYAHILGKMDTDEDVFFPVYQNAEVKLNESMPCYMSYVTENILRGIDYESIACKKKKELSNYT